MYVLCYTGVGKYYFQKTLIIKKLLRLNTLSSSAAAVYVVGTNYAHKWVFLNSAISNCPSLFMAAPTQATGLLQILSIE
jgi:hypothetical protein